MIFQEPMTSLNPLHTIEKQVGEVLFLHKGLDRRGGARGARSSCCELVGIAERRAAGSTPIRTSSPAASASA